jgi:CubicO group peptidase (beta-lactamase class C family)
MERRNAMTGETKRWLRQAAAIVLGCVMAGAATAQTPAAPPASPPAAHALTADDLGAWLDGLMPTALKTAEIPGAVVVVVKDGQVLFEKGYGYADYKSGKLVDPKVTLFRPGSVSKLFTWTAVMQQVEAGKIDLDADVNRYLDFHIPAYHGAPVTMRMLMTHRAGFSETARDLLTYGKAPPPLDVVLKRYVPPRIFAPDEGPGYSNYGASLAGYIVQRVSGEPFDAYVARHIFTPLGMAHSTFDQPLPAALAPDMSTGYVTADQPGKGFEIISMPPAGSLSATGDDMARFMIAHLQDGQYAGAQILQPKTAELMHTSLTKAFPDLDGNELGFYQQNIKGHRVIAHGGDTAFFHSDLSLFLDDHVGLFISVNGLGKGGAAEGLRQNVFEGFGDRYFPAAAAPAAPGVPLALAKAHAAMMAGAWSNTRRSDSTFIRIIELIQPLQVAADADGTISFNLLGSKWTYQEINPFLWRQVHGHDQLEATVANGKVTRWSTDMLAPIFVFVRPSGLAATGLAVPLALAALGFLLATALSWPWAAIARRIYGQRFALTGWRAWGYRKVRGCAWLTFVAIGLWLVVVQLVSETAGASVAALLTAAQIVSLIAVGGGFLAAAWNLWLTWKDKARWPAKLFAVLALAAFAFLLWLFLSYHLIGFSSEY